MSKLINTHSASMRSRTMALAAPTTHAAFRIIVGLLFAQHGAQKLFGLFGGVDGAGATVQLFSIFGAAGVLELFGGLLIVLGLLTRPVAFLLAGEMVYAYLTAHGPQGGFPIQNGGELAMLYAVSFAFLSAVGAGAWSIDALFAKDKTQDLAEKIERKSIAGPERTFADRPSAGPERQTGVTFPLIGHRRATSDGQ